MDILMTIIEKLNYSIQHTGVEWLMFSVLQTKKYTRRTLMTQSGVLKNFHQ